MRNILKYIGIIFVFSISFIYTEKISNYVKSKDSIMIDIMNIKDYLNVESVNAIVDDKKVIPGKVGCKIDVNGSYVNMKSNSKFDVNLIKYKDIIPNISYNNIYNKYISSGNTYNNNVSFVIYVKNINALNELNDIDVKLNIFLDSELLKNGKIDINGNSKIYNGGTDFKYDNVEIDWANEVIRNYNNPEFCLNINKNDEYLDKCSKNKMHTISPEINATNTYLAKKNLTNGSIIYFDESNIDNIKYLKNYVLKKGFNIVYLTELLDEGKCEK